MEVAHEVVSGEGGQREVREEWVGLMEVECDQMSVVSKGPRLSVVREL